MDNEVKYLLEEEERVNNLPCFNGRSPSCAVIGHPLEFLGQRPISSRWNVMQKGNRIPLDVREKYNITDAEELVFWLMIGECSFNFRDDKGVECRRQMIDIWERFLSKVPHCESSVVQRYLKSHDKMDFKIGDTWECPFSLTGTTNTINDWPLRDDESIYEIHLLKNGKTKAKCHVKTDTT